MVADCLSRPEITAAFSPSFTDYTELVLAQRDDPSIRELSQSMISLKLCERAIPNSGLLLLGDTSTGKFRPITAYLISGRICHIFRTFANRAKN